MANTEIACRIATTFTKSGELDEEAFRQFLEIFIESKIAVYIGSGGGGEGHSLTWKELERVYKIGVEVCKGKIPVYANPPEQYTVRGTIDYTQQAFDSGAEMVSIYGLASRHGMIPTDYELMAFFDDVFAVIKKPISIGVNSIAGYIPKAETIAAICKKHHQVTGVNLTLHENSDNYLMEIKNRVGRDILYKVRFCAEAFNSITVLGAYGVYSTDANVIPRTHREYIDLFEQRRYSEMAAVYDELRRFANYTKRWRPSAPRPIKMCMRLLKFPGGEGGLREPYRMPPEEEYKKFCDGLLRLNIREINDRARAAGVPLPS